MIFIESMLKIIIAIELLGIAAILIGAFIFMAIEYRKLCNIEKGNYDNI